MEKLLHDTREIDSVWVATNSEEGYWKVGLGGVTKIEIYGENGQMAIVNWCAIYQGEKITSRFDMAGMGVTYK
jgi:hypothetical protein